MPLQKVINNNVICYYVGYLVREPDQSAADAFDYKELSAPFFLIKENRNVALPLLNSAFYFLIV
ncbi:hypothetical protein BRC2024_PQPTKSFJ_CDS_0067 [Tegunavirus sp. BRC001]